MQERESELGFKNLPEDWMCPSCGRKKREIMRWKLRGKKDKRYVGWVAEIHLHHDHGEDFGRDPRFEPIKICSQCNAADGHMKTKLKLPKDFSFSPCEISRFISATANGWHDYDYEKAKKIFKNLESTI